MGKKKKNVKQRNDSKIKNKGSLRDEIFRIRKEMGLTEKRIPKKKQKQKKKKHET